MQTNLFSGSCFHDPVIAYFVRLWRRKRLWLVDEGMWFGSAEGRLGETSAVRPALTKTAPAQLHRWLPSLRWSPRQTWSCSCGWSHCWSVSGSQSCSVRGGERPTWAQTANLGLQLNIIQDCPTGTGLWDSDGISREPIPKLHNTI